MKEASLAEAKAKHDAEQLSIRRTEEELAAAKRAQEEQQQQAAAAAAALKAQEERNAAKKEEDDAAGRLNAADAAAELRLLELEQRSAPLAAATSREFVRFFFAPTEPDVHELPPLF